MKQPKREYRVYQRIDYGPRQYLGTTLAVSEAQALNNVCYRHNGNTDRGNWHIIHEVEEVGDVVSVEHTPEKAEPAPEGKHHLSIDLETFSSVEIRDAGAWRYIDSPDFEILLFAYAMDGNPTQVIDLASGEVPPVWLIDALRSPEYIKHAFNAAFEFAALSKVYGPMQPEQWRCSMVHALYCGYPGSLEGAGAAIGLPQEKQKLTVGKRLIQYFCKPVKPTKSNGGRTRNFPRHDPEKWSLFKAYNRQDVEAEMEIERRLAAYPMPPDVQKQWETDLRIARRGVFVDQDMVDGALAIGAETTAGLVARAQQITGLSNPNSGVQLLGWLTDRGADLTNLQKETVTEALKGDLPDDETREVLQIRQNLGKTSNKKYEALETCVCSDGRVRGLLQFYGANRTGRWAGRLVQVQNLPRTYIEQLDLARGLVKDRNAKALRLCFGSVQDTLSQLIRTTLTAEPGRVLIDADFSAIEARVISWLAGEEWRLEVFRTHGKIYEASAAQMFGVPIERIKKGNPEYALRARGKVAELALGYQGGVAAMRRMDVGHNLDNLGDDEVQGIVDQWRNTNPRIKQLWYDLQDAAIKATQTSAPQSTHGLTFRRETDLVSGHTVLTLTLPSGRKLFYLEPQLAENRWGGPSLSYLGVNQETKKWERIETYGGKLVENSIQAIARDCLAEAIENVEAAGLPVVFHIHDEVVIETLPFGTDDEMLHKVTELMTRPITWAPGLPLKAEGWVGKYFKKD